MTKHWQTNLLNFMPFPFACAKFEGEGSTPNAYGDETAFYCARAGHQYRIIESECEGMDCPCCEIRDLKEYERMLTENPKGVEN